MLWQEDKVESIDLPYPQLIHQVIIISHDEKHISSSEAHLRVKSSHSYTTRSQRANDNLKTLLSAMREKDWPSIYHICWLEFQDMHNLFSTSNPPFHYVTETTNEALRTLQNLWRDKGDGPIVTMDAGPNIHLLYRPDQADLALHFKQDFLIGNYDVL